MIQGKQVFTYVDSKTGVTQDGEKYFAINVMTKGNHKQKLSFITKDEELITKEKNEESLFNDIEKKESYSLSNSEHCYLTTACMKHYLNNFDDNCYELTVLRWFRDNFVSKEDIEHYYKVAPIIVEAINEEEKSDIIYDYMREGFQFSVIIDDYFRDNVPDLACLDIFAV